MSTESTSRRPVAALSGAPSLADVLNSMAADRTSSLRQRQDRCSAVRTLAKALGRRPEEIPAHPAYLQQRLKGFSPAMAGLTPRRWRNILSLTRAALKQAGFATVPGRYCGVLTPAWTDLYRYLNEVRLRVGLSRFAGRSTSANPGDRDRP